MLRENRGERMTCRLAVVYVICLAVMVASSATGSEHGGDLPDLFSLDVAKFQKQLACELPAVRGCEFIDKPNQLRKLPSAAPR
jgi:hypothetical protein